MMKAYIYELRLRSLKSMESVREYRLAKLREARDSYVQQRNTFCQERSCSWSDGELVSVYKHPKEITDLELKIKEIDCCIRLYRP